MESSNEKVKPLKRHPAFVPLSKDHHFGLLLCWKIRTGLKKSIPVERIASYVKYFFQDHLNKHFEEEETYIFTLVEENDVKRIEAEQQHFQIRKLVSQLSNEPENPKEILEALENDLEVHIRFEERNLFPYLQDKVPATQLEQLQQKIESIHVMEAEVWEDKFWIDK